MWNSCTRDPAESVCGRQEPGVTDVVVGEVQGWTGAGRNCPVTVLETVPTQTPTVLGVVGVTRILYYVYGVDQGGHVCETTEWCEGVRRMVVRGVVRSRED